MSAENPVEPVLSAEQREEEAIRSILPYLKEWASRDDIETLNPVKVENLVWKIEAEIKNDKRYSEIGVELLLLASWLRANDGSALQNAAANNEAKEAFGNLKRLVGAL